MTAARPRRRGRPRAAGVGLGIGLAAAVAVAGGGFAWYRWLRNRQLTWQQILADSIPVHSAYWRARREVPGELVYIALGDSAAQGIGASRPARSYVGVIARRIEKATGRTVRVINLGVSGATLATALEKEVPRFLHIDESVVADAVVTLAIGANDVAAWDAGRFAEQLDRLYAQLPRHTIVADLPSFYFLPGERKAEQGSRLIRAAAREFGLHVVDLHDTMRREGLIGVSTQFAGDLFHPNDRGYAVWADAFEVAVRERVAQILSGAASASAPGSPSGSADSKPRNQSRASTKTSSE